MATATLLKIKNCRQNQRKYGQKPIIQIKIMVIITTKEIITKTTMITAKMTITTEIIEMIVKMISIETISPQVVRILSLQIVRIPSHLSGKNP